MSQTVFWFVVHQTLMAFDEGTMDEMRLVRQSPFGDKSGTRCEIDAQQCLRRVTQFAMKFVGLAGTD